MRRLKRTFVKASTGVRIRVRDWARAEGTAETEMETRLSCWYNLMRQAAITTTTNEDSQVAYVVVVGQSSTTATTTATTMDSNS